MDYAQYKEKYGVGKRPQSGVGKNWVFMWLIVCHSLPHPTISLLQDHRDALHQNIAFLALADRAYLVFSLPQILCHLYLSHDLLVVLQVSMEIDGLADVDAQRKVISNDSWEKTTDKQSIHCFWAKLPLIFLLSFLFPLQNEVELPAGLKRILHPLNMFPPNLPISNAPRQCLHLPINQLNSKLRIIFIT